MRPARLPVTIPSPCISVCQLRPATGWCEGCLRTIDEIAAWSTMSEAAKWAVWKELRLRRALQPAPPTLDLPPGPA